MTGASFAETRAIPFRDWHLEDVMTDTKQREAASILKSGEALQRETRSESRAVIQNIYASIFKGGS